MGSDRRRVRPRTLRTTLPASLAAGVVGREGASEGEVGRTRELR